MKSIVLAIVACATVALPTIAQPPRGNAGSVPPPQGGASNPQQAGATDATQTQAVFSAFDADGDGEITKVEIRKAIAALKKLDADRDGKITRAEASINPANTNLQNQQGNVGTNAGLGNGGGFGGPGGGFNGAGDPRRGPNLMQYDTNGDGSLSQNEVPTHLRSMIRVGDQNGNGQLDGNELQLLGQRMNERVRGQRPLPPGVTVGPNGVERQP